MHWLSAVAFKHFQARPPVCARAPRSLTGSPFTFCPLPPCPPCSKNKFTLNTRVDGINECVPNAPVVVGPGIAGISICGVPLNNGEGPCFGGRGAARGKRRG